MAFDEQNDEYKNQDLVMTCLQSILNRDAFALALKSDGFDCPLEDLWKRQHDLEWLVPQNDVFSCSEPGNTKRN